MDERTDAREDQATAPVTGDTSTPPAAPAPAAPTAAVEPLTEAQVAAQDEEGREAAREVIQMDRKPAPQPGLARVVPKPGAEVDPDELEDLWDDEDEEEAPRVWKVPLRVVKADDMTVTVGEKRNRKGRIIKEGTTYAPHEGETVSFLPAVGVDTMFSTAGLILSNRGKSAKAMARMMTHMEELCDRLANVIAEWTLTGMDGRPLAQPYQNPAAIKAMSEDEVAWLIKHATGQADEDEEARGNA